ncbi:hypothetical protein RYX36_000619 [Vicia faba]
MEPSPPITTTTHRYNHSHRRVVDVAHTNGRLSSVSHPIQLHLLTRTPYVTGSSVIAIKYKDGILMAAGMGGSYGSTRRYKSVERLKPVGKHSIIGASGEISDFQEIQHYLNELIWLRVLLQVVPLKQRESLAFVEDHFELAVELLTLGIVLDPAKHDPSSQDGGKILPTSPDTTLAELFKQHPPLSLTSPNDSVEEPLQHPSPDNDSMEELPQLSSPPMLPTPSMPVPWRLPRIGGQYPPVGWYTRNQLEKIEC